MMFLAFQCFQPIAVFRTVQRLLPGVQVPLYNSVVEYTCNEGYWLKRGEYSRRVRCAEMGTWDPPINFTCKGME